jgi:outer membrane immunogenic protein
MKRILLAAVALAIAGTTATRAADMPLKAPPPVEAFSWTGFYIGAFAGYAWDWNSPIQAARATTGALPAGVLDLSGSSPVSYILGRSGIAGGTAGYNFQNGWAVIGSEVEVGWIKMSGSAAYQDQTLTNFLGLPPPRPCPLPPGVTVCPVSSATLGNWYATWSGRVGVTGEFLNPAWVDGNRLLIYGKAGPAVSQISDAYNLNCVAGSCGTATAPTLAANLTTGQKTVWGASLGAGLEWAFARNWSAKVEYELLMFPNINSACGTIFLPGNVFNGATACSQVQWQSGAVQTVKFGINYRFDWGGGPVIARY